MATVAIRWGPTCLCAGGGGDNYKRAAINSNQFTFHKPPTPVSRRSFCYVKLNNKNASDKEHSFPSTNRTKCKFQFPYCTLIEEQKNNTNSLKYEAHVRHLDEMRSSVLIWIKTNGREHNAMLTDVTPHQSTQGNSPGNSTAPDVRVCTHLVTKYTSLLTLIAN